MNVFTDICTLYNRKGDSYQRTILSGVSFHRTRAVSFASGNLETANTVAVNIPLSANTQDRQYLPAKQWEDTENSEFHWTMQDGDLLVYGVCEFEFGAESTLSDLQELIGVDSLFTVYYWNDSLKGSPSSQHYRMEGK